MNKLLQHLVHLEREAARLSVEQAKAFCLMCLERHIFAYDKATSIVTPEAAEAARSCLDSLWQGISVVEPLPIFEARTQSEDTALNFIMSVHVFLGIQPKNVAASCRAVAEFSLNTVDALAHELLDVPPGREGNELIDSSPLVSNEILRQEQDIRRLENIYEAADFQRLKESSKIDITQGTWFLD